MRGWLWRATGSRVLPLVGSTEVALPARSAFCWCPLEGPLRDPDGQAAVGTGVAGAATPHPVSLSPFFCLSLLPGTREHVVSEFLQARTLTMTPGSRGICHFYFPGGETKAHGVSSVAQCLVGSDPGSLTRAPSHNPEAQLHLRRSPHVSP